MSLPDELKVLHAVTLETELQRKAYLLAHLHIVETWANGVRHLTDTFKAFREELGHLQEAMEWKEAKEYFSPNIHTTLTDACKEAARVLDSDVLKAHLYKLLTKTIEIQELYLVLNMITDKAKEDLGMLAVQSLPEDESKVSN
jgi:hypothetical protein